MIFRIWYKNLDRSFLRFVTMHAFYRQTGEQTEFSSLDRICISCTAVKIVMLNVKPNVEKLNLRSTV